MPNDNELTFCLVPFGEVPKWILKYAGELIAENFGARTVNLRPRPLPPETYLPDKEAYNPDRLLDVVKFEAHARGLMLIGLAPVKLHDPTDGANILGLAIVGGPAVLVSVPVCPEPDEKAKVFIRNVLLHELGHFFGLDDRSLGRSRLADLLYDISSFFGLIDYNCGKKCLMNDRTKISEKNLVFCPICKEWIEKKLLEYTGQK